jgi:hypothetical protein
MLTSTPSSISRRRYSSKRSSGTSNARWFIEACAEAMSPRSPGSVPAFDTPGCAGPRRANQKKARQSSLPMSKKKCCPMPPGSSIVLTSGMPSTSR